MRRVTTLTLAGFLEDALDPDVAQQVFDELAVSPPLQRRLERLRARLQSRDTRAHAQEPAMNPSPLIEREMELTLHTTWRFPAGSHLHGYERVRMFSVSLGCVGQGFSRPMSRPQTSMMVAPYAPGPMSIHMLTWTIFGGSAADRAHVHERSSWSWSTRGIVEHIGGPLTELTLPPFVPQAVNALLGAPRQPDWSDLITELAPALQAQFATPREGLVRGCRHLSTPIQVDHHDELDFYLDTTWEQRPFEETTCVRFTLHGTAMGLVPPIRDEP